MKKIPSLFVRNYERIITDLDFTAASTMPGGSVSAAYNITDSRKGRFLATDQVTPGCEWVINGEGVATRKWDGTCCMIRDGLLYKRYDAKHGKTPPPGFEPAQDPDPVTGHWPGWVRADLNAPGDIWIMEAYLNTFPDHIRCQPRNGTYEAIGPKIGDNKDQWRQRELVRHGEWRIHCPNRSYDAIKEALIHRPIEGIVFHHPDGRMCKVKRTDFGVKW